jgi:serine/threonine protein kinase
MHRDVKPHNVMIDHENRKASWGNGDGMLMVRNDANML